MGWVDRTASFKYAKFPLLASLIPFCPPVLGFQAFFAERMKFGRALEASIPLSSPIFFFSLGPFSTNFWSFF